MIPTRSTRCPTCHSKKIVHPNTGNVALHCYACGFERWREVPTKIVEKPSVESFFGILSKASVDKLEQAIHERRKT